jgi:hypothetical protein
LGGAPLPATTGYTTPRDMLVRNGKLPDPPMGRVDYVQRPPATATP